MARQKAKNLLSAPPAGEFFGRETEIRSLLAHAKGTLGLRLASAPWSGASELLRLVFDRLFFDQDEIIPFYFALKPSDQTVRQMATRFVHEFISQAVAFGRRDPAVYFSSPDIRELSRLALSSDTAWLEMLVENYETRGGSNDERAFLRNAL